MNKVAMWKNVRLDDWTTELVLIAVMKHAILRKTSLNRIELW